MAGGGEGGTSETETKILRGRRNEGSREKKEEGKRERGIEADCKSSGNEAPSSRGLTDLFDVHGPTCLPTCLSTYLPTYLSTYCTYAHVYVYASNNAHMQKAHHRPPPSLCLYIFLPFLLFRSSPPSPPPPSSPPTAAQFGPPMRAGPRGISKRIISPRMIFHGEKRVIRDGGGEGDEQKNKEKRVGNL